MKQILPKIGITRYRYHMRINSILRPRFKQHLSLFILSAICVVVFGLNGEMFLSSLTAHFKEKILYQFGAPIVEKMQKADKYQFDLRSFLEPYRSIANRVDGMLADHAAAVAFLARSDNKIGVYLNSESVADEDFFRATLGSLEAAGGNALVFDVKGAYVYFESSSPLAKELELVRPLYDLPGIVAEARARGFYTIARLIAAKDPILSSYNPDTRIRHPITNASVGFEWVDLSSPKVLEYNRQVMIDVVLSGVDEINIDYIRYPTEYHQSSIGLTKDEKAERIETFIRMARSVIDQYNTPTKLGVSTYAILGWNYDVNVKPLGQDVVRFAPYLDVISPMAYPSTFKLGGYYNPNEHPRSRMYYLVYRTLTGYAEILGEEHAYKLRPWIQGYYVTQKNMRDQMDAVFDAGYCGFTVWSAGNHYDKVYKLIPEVDIPERCTSYI